MIKRFMIIVALLVAGLFVVGCTSAEEPVEEEPVTDSGEEMADDGGEEMTDDGEEMADDGGEEMTDDGEEMADDGGEEMTDDGGEMAAMPEECAEEGACAVIEPGDTIKIGYAGPTQGEFAAFGQDISQGGLIAIQDNPEFEGFEYELLIEDTGGSGEGGAAVANLFSAEPTVVAIAGHTFSGSTEAAIPIYDESRIPMLSPSATATGLTEMGSDVFNRIAFSDSLQGELAARYMLEELELTEIAVLHDGSSYGQGLAEIVQTTFEELGGTVTSFQAITTGEADYSGVLSAISAEDPGALYFGGYSADASVIANGIDTSGLGDAIFFSGDGTYGVDFLENAGDNANGTYATSLVPPPSEQKEAFDTAYEERFGVAPGTLSAFTWSGYDIVAALQSAIESVAVVGDDGNLYVPREALIDAVRGLEGFEGITGTITCDDVGECNTAGPTFYQVQDGAWTLVEFEAE